MANDRKLSEKHTGHFLPSFDQVSSCGHAIDNLYPDGNSLSLSD